jgi:5-hydroxyisourate hydrolase
MKITAQVADSTYGRWASGVRSRLESASGDDWRAVANAKTNHDGCIEQWDGRVRRRGLYRIVFDSGSYFAELGTTTAYPEVVIVFRMLDDSDVCRVHVSLSPYSYSTHVASGPADCQA